MPIPNNPLVVRANLVFRAYTRHFINSLHFSDASGWDLAKMQDLSDELKAWWDSPYGDQMSNQVQLEQVQVRLLDPLNPLALDDTVGLPIGGANPNIHEPFNVTSTISWRTGLAGRKFRGRNYVVGLCENNTNEDDTVSSDTVIALSAAAQNLLTRAATLAANLVVFHLANNTFTPVISYVIENIIDSQRRRLPGRGR